MKKKVVIFGGSGFLGSHTADELTSNNFKVTIFDKNPSSFLKKNQDFIQGDIFDNNKINKVLKNKDYVYNFVALSNLEQSLKDPISTIDINLKSCINLLILSKKNNIKKFIFSSTFYVGGDYGGFYRCSKSASEDYIKEFYRVYGLKYSILRFGSLYGPRSDYNNGIYNILKNFLINYHTYIFLFIAHNLWPNKYSNFNRSVYNFCINPNIFINIIVNN